VERLIRNNQQQEATQDDEDAFGNEFQNAELSEAAHARDEEFFQEVDAKLRVEFEHVGDAVGENGDVLHVRGTDGEAPMVLGLEDTSTVYCVDVVVSTTRIKLSLQY
jgi:hypothetical protein